jgi:hypothetical protein
MGAQSDPGRVYFDCLMRPPHPAVQTAAAKGDIDSREPANDSGRLTSGRLMAVRNTNKAHFVQTLGTYHVCVIRTIAALLSFDR